MNRKVKRGSYRRSCPRCGWQGTYDTAAKGDYAKRRHSCARHQAKAAGAERYASRMAAVDRTPKPCLHKQADHQHGTYACYTLDACRCAPCVSAQRAYEVDRVRQKAYGRWNGLIDAEPARQHVQRLMAAGMGLKRIVVVSGVSQGVMWKLLYGVPRTDGTRRPPQQRIKPTTAERLLGLELDLADGALVANTDTARRLQALVTKGWSMSKLGALLDVSPGNFNPVVLGRRSQVTAGTARRVHALYLELAEQAPPEETHHDKVAASRSRNYAAARGWSGPLRIGGRLHVGPALPLPELEDAEVLALDETAYDEAAVARRLDGDRTARIGKAERVEIVRRARALGWSLLTIERRTGVTKPERYLEPSSRPHDEPGQNVRACGEAGHQHQCTDCAGVLPPATTQPDRSAGSSRSA
ncbi:hypothetical protein ABKW28_12900 [Nocardioides sp. 31GB23]|uniref:hypothetical protein n=1 Tax=Nocardioides sp. 31GB23 TaxID=3156065 RepID=UPI0032AEC370